MTSTSSLLVRILDTILYSLFNPSTTPIRLKSCPQNRLFTSSIGTRSLNTRQVDAAIRLGIANGDPVISISRMTARRSPRFRIRTTGILVRVPLTSKSREYLDNQRPENRQASTDNCQVRLDNSPHNIGNIIGLVWRRCQDIQTGDSKTRCNNDKDSNGKHTHQSNLLKSRDIKLVYERHRHQQDDDISSDRKSGIGIPELRIIHANAINSLVEGASDRTALEDGDENRGYAVHGYYGQHCPAHESEPSDDVEKSQV